jgi:uncharacterized delta-60 repeat protein
MDEILDERSASRPVRRSTFACFVVAGLLAGCSDSSDGSGQEHDASQVEAGGDDDDASARQSDAGEPEGDASTSEEDAGGDHNEADAGPDAGEQIESPLTERFAAKTPLSADQADRFWAAAFGKDGKIYAAGFTTLSVGGVADRVMAVARFATDGTLDTSYGEQGVATVNVFAASSADDITETARGIGVQSDGKIVLVGNVKRADVQATVDTLSATLPEVDLAIARFTTEGKLDSSGAEGFSVGDADGKDGVYVLNLGDMVPAVNSAGTALSATNEQAWGLAIDSKDRTLVFASGMNEAPPADGRVDLDRYVVRFTKAGALDAAFAGDGKFSFDAGGKVNDSARNGVVLEGDRVLSAGYTNLAGKNTVALMRLEEDGTRDASFGSDGLVTSNPLAPDGVAEAYGLCVQSNGKYISVGYGNAGTPPNALLSFRFETDGALDTAWGENGVLMVDELADAEQGRNLVALPDDRLLAVGNGSPATGAADGLVLLFTKNGELDASYNGSGYMTFDWGLASDAFYGVALSADAKYVVAAGYAGAASNATADQVAREDAALVIFALED